MGHTLDYQSKWFTCHIEDEIAVFRFGRGAFEIGSTLESKERFFFLLDKIEASPDVRALLFLNSPGALNENEYGEFLQKVSRKNIEPEQQGVDDRSKRDVLLQRTENALNQFILKIHRSNKVVIIGMQGRVATPFLGCALAFDFRLVSDSTVFLPSHIKFGVPPDGALGFFLPRFVGLGKAVEMLLSNHPVSAAEACQLGLVNAVFPAHKFEKKCVEKTKELAQVPLATISYSKSLLYPHREEELEHYLAREFSIMHSALSR